jgi:hypothetical protein
MTTERELVPTFSPGTLQLLRSILGDNYVEHESYKRAVEQFAKEDFTVKAGSPAPLTGGGHGPCC